MKIGIFTQAACIAYLSDNIYYQQLSKDKQVDVVNACLSIIEKLPDYELNKNSRIIEGRSLHNIKHFRDMFNDFIKGLK